MAVVSVIEFLVCVLSIIYRYIVMGFGTCFHDDEVIPEGFSSFLN